MTTPYSSLHPLRLLLSFYWVYLLVFICLFFYLSLFIFLCLIGFVYLSVGNRPCLFAIICLSLAQPAHVYLLSFSGRFSCRSYYHQHIAIAPITPPAI